MMYRIAVRRLWRESAVGAQGYIGAELQDGTLVALCSVEKFDLGPDDSLRKGWLNNQRVFPRVKLITMDVPEAELRRDGLGIGSLAMSGLPS